MYNTYTNFRDEAIDFDVLSHAKSLGGGRMHFTGEKLRIAEFINDKFVKLHAV